MSANPLPEPKIDPPETERTMKRIAVYVRFAGVYVREIDVPLDLDTSDYGEVSNALDNDCRENRPAFATNPPEEWEFWNWTLGEFAYEAPGFNDPGKKYGMDTPRIFIEAVEED